MTSRPGKAVVSPSKCTLARLPFTIATFNLRQDNPKAMKTREYQLSLNHQYWTFMMAIRSASSHTIGRGRGPNHWSKESRTDPRRSPRVPFFFLSRANRCGSSHHICMLYGRSDAIVQNPRTPNERFIVHVHAERDSSRRHSLGPDPAQGRLYRLVPPGTR